MKDAIVLALGLQARHPVRHFGRQWKNAGMPEPSPDNYTRNADSLFADETPETAFGARADLEKVPGEVAAMFDGVADRYDITNDVISLGQVYLWRYAVNRALRLQPGHSVLDVAAGTGTSSAALASTGARVVAVDISEGMIEVGRERHPEIEFVEGSATALPFADASFDAATISFGLRNIDDPLGALREMVRVVKPGGSVLVCEFSTSPPLVRPFHRAYLKYGAPALARALSPAGEAYDYLSESILEWMDQATLGQLMVAAGLKDVEFRNLTWGAVALHRGRKP